MNELLRLHIPFLLDSLSQHGWVNLPNAMEKSDCRLLLQELELRHAAGNFQAAQIGQGALQTEVKRIRSDQIQWIAADDPQVSVQHWLNEIQDLMRVLNENFFLSIHTYDCHFACYEPGAHYQKHVDRFRGDPNRVMSVILFLNENWLADEAGELLIYDQTDRMRVIAEIKPEIGTIVIFQSETVAHEVRTTKRRRLSLTGWLKTGA